MMMMMMMMGIGLGIGIGNEGLGPRVGWLLSWFV